MHREGDVEAPLDERGDWHTWPARRSSSARMRGGPLQRAINGPPRGKYGGCYARPFSAVAFAADPSHRILILKSLFLTCCFATSHTVAVDLAS